MAMTFARAVVDRLGFDAEVDASNGRPPFGLDLGRGRQLDWSEVGLVEHADTDLSATFVTPDGLRTELQARRFPGSRAIEVSGAVRNDGAETLRDVTGCATTRLFLSLDPAWAEPLIRTWRGVRLIPNFFPPVDFERNDRRLMRMPVVVNPLSIHAGTDGRSSSNDLPFLIIAGSDGGLAVAVEWSGTWFASLEQDAGSGADNRRFDIRLEAGLWGISLQLRPGESLPLPTVILVPYEGGEDEGGNALRRHLRKHVMPPLAGQEMLPPTSFNHWFAFENDFTDALLRPAVDAAADAGLEYFVVDAGWFSGGMPHGIGNWENVDPTKFPNGVEPFARHVESRGMRYGTWFEPEYAHVDSDLHRRHPEWFFPPGEHAVGVSFRPWSFWFETFAAERGVSMAEYLAGYRMLDFGIPEVQQYWIDRLTVAHREWGLRWIRWDSNHAPLPNWRAAAEPGWAQIRHLQGLYAVWEHLIETLPDLVIEHCAGGGQRIDPATVRRGHVFWINDHTFHTDVVRRMQTRLNQVLPGSYLNTNLCQGRHDYSDYDYLSHGCGGFGYSGRLWEAPKSERLRFTAAVDRFKRYRHVLLGDYTHELPDPQDHRAREVHVWQEEGQELSIEFNGSEGPATAAAGLDSLRLR